MAVYLVKINKTFINRTIKLTNRIKEVISVNIGEKIKRLRLENSLTQEELADRCELTKGYISQLERNLTSPSIATLINILEILGTSLPEFFNEIKQEKIVFTKEDVFKKQEFEQGFTINWIVPDAQKRTMEPILLELEAGASTKMEEPHQGEEFGYVLVGRISLEYGKRKLKIKAGESFYYKANRTHQLTNTSKSIAKIIWVSTPPNF